MFSPTATRRRRCHHRRHGRHHRLLEIERRHAAFLSLFASLRFHCALMAFVIVLSTRKVAIHM